MNSNYLKGKRTAAYGRYSSENQNERSADDQIDRCVERAANLGGRIPNEWRLKDDAVSGGSIQRAGFDTVRALIKARQIDVLLVEDWDRLSRNFADSATLFAELRFYDVELITVSDGMSSRAPSAKTHFFLKGFMSEAFLDNLADKTLRGQLARFRAGHATGRVPYGFLTKPHYDADGKPIFFTIHIDEEAAEIVRRIFREYLAGRSLALITTGLNHDGVPPPRSKKRKGSAAWGDSTVRSILHNCVYVGVWRFALRRWEKEPGTLRREPKKRPPTEVPPEQIREHLRIIDPATWEAVQARLSAVRAHYVKADTSGRPTVQGKPSAYLLSGLMVCGDCGALMFVNGGTKYRRYRCTANARRGTCANRVTVKEWVARTRIVAAVQQTVENEFVSAYAKKQAARVTSTHSGGIEKELRARKQSLEKTVGRIRGLYERIADGQRDEYAEEMLADWKRTAEELKREIATLEEARERKPTPLPRQERVAAHLRDLRAFLDRDVLAGREYFRSLLRGREIRLCVGTDGVYTAHAELLPMVLLTEPPPPVDPEGAVSSQHCGGRI